MRRAAVLVAVVLSVVPLLLSTAPAAAADLAFVAEADGAVTLVRGGVERAAALGETLVAADLLRVGAGGSLEIAFRDGSTAEAGEGAVVRIGALAASRTSLGLDRGALRALVERGRERGRSFEIVTPAATAGVRGTDFGVEYVGGEEATVDVFEGEVEVSPPAPAGEAAGGVEPQRVRAGESARARLRHAIQRRRIAASRRAAWDARRGRLEEAVHKRIREAIESGRATPADVYRHLPAEIRERLKSRFEDRIRRLRDAAQTRRRRAAEAAAERRPAASRLRTQDRRERSQRGK